MLFLTQISGPEIQDTPSPRWIFDRIEEWARRSPDRAAFVIDHEDRVDRYRYPDVLEQAAAIAATLAEHGVGRGDHVGILMENVPQWVFALLGAMRLGAVTVPLATTLPEASIRLIAEHAACKVIVADESNWSKAAAVAKELGAAVMDAGGSVSKAAAAGSPPMCMPERSQTAILIYTSGTTGNPKGVELTFDNLNHEIAGAAEGLRLSPDHRILSVLPFSHVLPLIANGLGPLCIGATVVFLSSISPQRIVEAFHRHRISLFICVPQFFYLLHRRIFSQAAAQPFPVRLVFRFLKSAARRIGSPQVRRRLFSKVHRTIGPDLQMFASGGSHFDPSVARDLSDLGYTVLQAYGLTETSAAATVTPAEANRIGSAGKPMRGVSIRIENSNDKGIGEVWIRGPIVMKGYYRSPEQTAAVLRDGWFQSGDLGFIDRDGYLWITGRSKDVIVLANGENVYPEELETHYAKSPFIKEICILGVSGEGAGGGSALHAIVVPDMDEFKQRGQTAIMEMIRFEIENLSRQVPSYYRIHSLAVRNDPLPRTATRKLKRFEIQQEEAGRRKLSESKTARQSRGPAEDDAVFRSRAGSVIAELVRESKAEIGALQPSMNIELDLGFDSLARVELLGLAEARLGTHIDEHEASRIFTLGELVQAFEAASASSEAPVGRSWKEILDAAPKPLSESGVLNPRPLLDPISYGAMRLLKLLGGIFLNLRHYGLEKLPQTPFLLCPNHESFLDGPLLIALLPKRAIYKIFILGYSDYWQSAISRRIAQLCRIVSVDPNVNLVRAMQAGAVGLKKGRALLIFPEGTRSIDGRVAEFKKGAAILALELQVPIVPVGIRGAFETWPRGGRFRFHPIEFHFGEPIEPGPFQGAPDPYAALTEKLRNEVMRLSGDF